MNKGGKKYLNLIKEIDWNNSKDIQKKAIDKILKDDEFDLEKITLSKVEKNLWYNCSKILISKGYPKNKKVIDEMFLWLQDMNWPGAKEIYDYLPTLPKEIFMKHYEIAVKKAIIENDVLWLEFLSCYISDFNLTEKDFNEKNLFNELI